MIPSVEREDWEELITTLSSVEKTLCLLDDPSEKPERIENCRQKLRSFHTTAAMLGLNELEQAGVGLEQCLGEKAASDSPVESFYPVGLAINGIVQEMKHAANGGGQVSPANVSEALKVLTAEGACGIEKGRANGEAPEPPLSDEEAIEQILDAPVTSRVTDFTRLERIVANLGGRLTRDTDGEGASTFQIQFDAVPAVVEQIETLLSPSDPNGVLSPHFSNHDTHVQKVVDTIREFMLALSSGDMKRAQEILLLLSEQQKQAGLYNEIGMLARDLHNSLKTFADTLDPALKEIVEEKIPDSGNRLEHILQITEKAANTTLDHVESLQKRNHDDQGRLLHLKEILGSLKALGEQAQKKLEMGAEQIEVLCASADQTHKDLFTVLTAQDYQDLTGQVIQKIITLLRDLELKLVSVIRAFGMKVEAGKKTQDEELYGPAHDNKEGALHSQDDVDDLLAEFGF